MLRQAMRHAVKSFELRTYFESWRLWRFFATPLSIYLPLFSLFYLFMCLPKNLSLRKPKERGVVVRAPGAPCITNPNTLNSLSLLFFFSVGVDGNVVFIQYKVERMARFMALHGAWRFL